MKTKKIEFNIDLTVDVISQDIMVGISRLISRYQLYIQTHANDFNSCDIFSQKISIRVEFYNLEQMFAFNKEIEEILL